ncbi:hypothetical protein [Aeromicrobium yanjiei]|uniref:Uncharacterized protein n=1 Tax=Aeromicrobium yanjiei TaxID=2662028 RepID=A0A5Q2MGJ0_9ACTN|nr:hypothetical protein [Aeromicrobium yanjiei]QGG41768.1 hypothetical protein GEV26_10565 [Aeromicrobium yanjiei]
MSDIGEVRFGGRAKWGAVATNLIIAALGTFLVVVAFVAVPADVHALRALGWYTVAATVLTVALAVALAATGRLPTVDRVDLDGEEARGVESWPWQWRYDLVIDLGLGAALLTVAGIGLVEGGSWLVPSVAVGLVGIWFLVRAILSASGRRRNEALWLTSSELVHDTVNGRERCGRASVTRVAAIDQYVVADIEGRTRHQPAPPPRPWRRRRRLDNPRTVVFDTTLTGHTPQQMADWLRTELELTDRQRLRR